MNATPDHSAVIPTPSQSTAALLPPEIVDCIFEHFDFDYSLETRQQDQIVRSDNLSNMSVIAEGWRGPARRLLCRTVCVWRWEQLAEGVPEWARGGLQNASIQHSSWRGAQSHDAASAFFKFFQHAPNLRLLHLDCPPFHSFDASDSVLMRTTPFLPLLRDLTVSSGGPFPHSVISDILAASDYQVRRLRLQTYRSITPPIPRERLDFGGNLRYLHVEGHSSALNCFQPLPSSLDGLKEMYVETIDGQSSDRARRLLTEVAASLEKLTIRNGDVTGIVASFPLLTRLTRLWIPRIPASSDSLLLPPSLVSLQCFKDDNLLPLLDRWNAEPSLLPATLQQINIRWVMNLQTFERLPPLARFVTVYNNQLVESLRRLTPRTLSLTALEVYFDRYRLDKVAAVEAECERLEVEYHRRHESLD